MPLILAWAAGLLAGVVQASPRIELGRPQLRHYSSAETGNHDQIWRIHELEDGALLLGTGSGLSVFDGVHWYHVRDPKLGRVFDFEVAADGRIFTGSTGEVGFLEPTGDGAYRYQSLLLGDAVASEPVPRFGDIRRVAATPDGIYFSGNGVVFVWQAARGLRWIERGDIEYIQEVAGELWLVTAGGVFTLAPTDLELSPVPGAEALAGQSVKGFLRRSEDSWWAVGEHAIFLSQRGTFQRVETAIDAILASTRVTCQRVLEDGSLLLGTRDQGVYILDREGTLIRQLGEEQGLSQLWVTDVLVDVHGTWWLAHGSQGITRVDHASGVTLFERGLGVSFAEGLTRHRGHLFAATVFGLRVLVPASTPQRQARFEPLEGMPEPAWALLDAGDRLLVGGVSSIYSLEVVDETVAPPRVRFTRVSEGHWRVATLSFASEAHDTVFATLADGLLRLDRQPDGGWVSRGKHHEISSHTYFAEPGDESTDGGLWVGTVNEGYLHLTDLELWPRSPWRAFGPEAGVPRGNSHVFRWRGQLLFGTYEGAFTFDPRREPAFAPDPRFEPRLIDGSTDIHRFQDPGNGGAPWLIAGSNVGPLVSEQGGFAVDGRHLRRPTGWRVYAVYLDLDGVVWLGGREGVVRYDPCEAKEPLPQSLPLRFGRVSSLPGGETLRAGAISTPAGTRLQLGRAGAGLRFEFAMPDSLAQGGVLYRSLLAGLDQEWSPWSNEAQRDFTNLPGGTLEFVVEAEDRLGRRSRSAPLTLEVPSAWYATWWSRGLGIGVVLSLAWLVGRWRSAAVLHRNEELERAVAERTAEVRAQAAALAAANEQLHQMSHKDLLTGLGNRRLATAMIEQEVARLRRDGSLNADASDRSQDLSFLLIDVDHFKKINDSYGHAVGDQVLRSIAEILELQSRDADGVVRWGGEEFLVICRCSPRDRTAEVAERLRSAIEGAQLAEVAGSPVRATVSMGFASFPLMPADPEAISWSRVISVADQALYAAKHCGRNGWVGIAVAPDAVIAGSALPGSEQTSDLASPRTSLRALLAAWRAGGQVAITSSFAEVPDEVW